MKVVQNRKIDFFDIDRRLQLKFAVWFKFLQEAAITHSEKVGMGTESLSKRNVAWVLSKLGIEVFRYPHFGEQVKIVTWSRGIKGMKAYRDFEIYSGDEKLAAAASIWFLLDRSTHKILRIPAEIGEIYTSEEDRALAADLDRWKADVDFEVRESVEITTRYSDYDSNDHVNNAQYFDYLETALAMPEQKDVIVSSIKIQFRREISRDTRTVRVGLGGNTEIIPFKIFTESEQYAGGSVTVRLP